VLLRLIPLFVAAVATQALDPSVRNTSKIEFDNSSIRAVTIHYRVRGHIDLQDHPARFVVSLSDGHTRETFADGTSREFQSRTGTVRWEEAGRCTVENLSDVSADEVIVEFKRARSPAVPVGGRTVSPHDIEPMPAHLEPHHHVTYENQYARVMEVVLEPGEASLFHTHAADVVYITLANARARGQQLGKEWTSPTEFRKGDVSMDEASRAPFTHHLQNIGTTEFRTINIEILR
jgi:hypothetical protein